MAYNVKLDIFEGPLDLLLHLIKKNEVDIYDIPIAVITEQYLEYIEMLKEMNLDFAGEFLVMAATLVHIKSKTLLPVDEEDTLDEDDGIDPREELVARLLEYQKYKQAASELSERPILGKDVFSRGVPEPLDGLEEGLGFANVSVFELMEAFKVILAKAPKETTLEIKTERFRIADKINYIIELLGEKKSATFLSLFPEGASRGEIIITFLAVLELGKLLMIKIHQTDDGVIRVYMPEPSSGSAGAGPDGSDETSTLAPGFEEEGGAATNAAEPSGAEPSGGGEVEAGHGAGPEQGEEQS